MSFGIPLRLLCSTVINSFVALVYVCIWSCTCECVSESIVFFVAATVLFVLFFFQIVEYLISCGRVLLLVL